MAFITKLRSNSLLNHLRNFSSASASVSPSLILCGDSKTILTSDEKTRAALKLLRTETNPEKILDICRAAALTPESHFDRVAFTIAVNKLAKSNYFEGIRVFLEELKNRPDLRNERFLSKSILLYGQAGMINNAISTFEQMEQLGIPRTVKSFNALLFSCILAKKWEELKRIYSDFPSMYNIELDVDSYNNVIKAFSETGESSAGYSIIAEMGRKNCKPNATTFTNLISGVYKEEKFEEVDKVLKLMEEHEKTPGLNMYNIRIRSLCNLGRSAEAKALFDGLRKKKIKPNINTFFNLIQGFCKEGKFDDAKKIYESMINRGCKPHRFTYFTLVFFLSRAGDYETALEICKQSIEKNWVPKFTIIKSLVEGLVSVSKVDEAKELVELLKRKLPKNAEIWKETEEKLFKEKERIDLG